MTPPVHIKQVTRRRELKEFIHLPERIHRFHERWVPPLYADERRLFHPQKNKALAYCDVTAALAYRNDDVVGRIMGIINRRDNRLRNTLTARFGCLECIDDQDVAFALLDHIEDWSRKQGMNKIVGPMGFTDQDPEGFLVEGYEHEPTIATYYNYAYLVGFLEAGGYEKEVDYVVYNVPVPETLPAVQEKICRRALRRTGCTLLEFARRRELRPYIRQVFELMNETFYGLYGYVPLDEDEMEDLAKRYLPVIDPRFVKAVSEGDRLVGFILGIPNMNEGLRRARGRLFPFGILKILQARRRSRQLDLLLGGIRQE